MAYEPDPFGMFFRDADADGEEEEDEEDEEEDVETLSRRLGWQELEEGLETGDHELIVSGVDLLECVGDAFTEEICYKMSALTVLGRHEEVVELCEQRLECDDSEELRVALVAALCELGRFQEARGTYKNFSQRRRTIAN
jgi:tetratricopeptide (TPR) repeat protein